MTVTKIHVTNERTDARQDAVSSLHPGSHWSVVEFEPRMADFERPRFSPLQYNPKNSLAMLAGSQTLSRPRDLLKGGGESGKRGGAPEMCSSTATCSTHCTQCLTPPALCGWEEVFSLLCLEWVFFFLSCSVLPCSLSLFLFVDNTPTGLPR